MVHNQWRGSPARRAVANSKALSFAGFRTPDSIYWGKVAGVGDFIFSNKVPGDTLAQWLNRRDGSTEQRNQRRVLLQAVGITLGRLHASGFLHGQLAGDNILAQQVEGRFEITLTNNEQLTRKHPPSGQALLKELRRLHGTLPARMRNADKLRLFTAWRRQMRHLNKIETKIIAEAIPA